MAIDFSQVKTITIPEGSVNKITDSNNNIIWGSESAFPYRILEYIDIPADAYLDLNAPGSSNVGLKLDINFNPLGQSTQQSNNNIFGSIYYDGSTYYRYHITSTNNGLLQVWFGTGNYSYKNSDIYSNDSNRHLIELNIHSIKDKKLYVDNVDKGTYTTTSTLDTGSLYLGARRFNNNGNITINNYNRTIRVYYCEIAHKSYSIDDPKDMSKLYPVQRKSDGKVGLLKVWKDGEAVRLCVSETPTDCIAGPTVNEYYEGKNWVN